MRGRPVVGSRLERSHQPFGGYPASSLKLALVVHRLVAGLRLLLLLVKEMDNIPAMVVVMGAIVVMGALPTLVDRMVYGQVRWRQASERRVVSSCAHACCL